MSFKSRGEATAEAKKTLKLMRGRGWKIRVWENMGWHYEVGSGPVAVFPETFPTKGKTRYWSMVNSEPDNFGPGAGIWTNSGASKYEDDPNAAAKEAVLDMLQVMSKLDAVRLKALAAIGR